MSDLRLPVAKSLCDAASGPGAWVVIWQLGQREWVVVSMDDAG